MRLRTEGAGPRDRLRSRGSPTSWHPVRDRIRWDERGRFDKAGPTFAVDHADAEVFVQNAEEHTHGFVAPDLGMGAIAQLGHPVAGPRALRRTMVEKRIAFQEWGIPDRYREVESERKEVPA